MDAMYHILSILSVILFTFSLNFKFIINFKLKIKKFEG
jgi:hypothetical protein